MSGLYYIINFANVKKELFKEKQNWFLFIPFFFFNTNLIYNCTTKNSKIINVKCLGEIIINHKRMKEKEEWYNWFQIECVVIK